MTMMTSTQPQKLTGAELIAFVESNPFDVLELPKLCGYASMEDFVANLKEAKEKEARVRIANQLLMIELLDITKEDFLEFTGEDGVNEILPAIGALGYRYLLYQFMLDIEGLEDQQLADQQVEFAEDILRKTKALKVIDSFEARTLIIDTIGVMINLIAFVHTGRWGSQAEKDAQTDAQGEAKRKDYRQWANNLPLIQEMNRIANIDVDEADVEFYNKQQESRHSLVATYLRTQIVDCVTGAEHTKTEGYLQNLDLACLYTYFLDQNSQWTTTALTVAVATCIKYDFHSEKEPTEMVQTARDMIDNMVEAGKAVAEKL